MGYLHAGAELKERGLLEKKISWKWWGIILALILFSAAFGQVSIVACMWKLGLADVLATFCTGFLLLRIYASYMRREHTGRLMSVLEEIGFNSIWIVCLHAYEKVIFPWYRLTDARSTDLLCRKMHCDVYPVQDPNVSSPEAAAEEKREICSGLKLSLD